jgi:outer membrane protein assembly factor BamA
MKVEFDLVDKDDDQFVPCNFDNIVWLPESQLTEELHNRVPLFNGTVPRDGALAEDVSAALQSLLKTRGVAANVVADVQQPTNNGTTEAVVFRATDVDIKIARLTIPGASPALAADLEAESKRIVGTAYNRGSLKKFAERNLRSVYLKRGYLRAAFSSPTVEIVSNNPTETAVAVAIPVSEGLPYKFASLRWSGNKALSAEELDKQIHPAPGQVLDGADLAKQVDAVRTRYAAMGYMHMLSAANPTYNDVAGTVSYELAINEGDLFQMGKLEIEGLQAASADKVHQAWKLREGDPFDSTYVHRFFTQFRLPADTPYLVEETEGERPRSIDLTIIFCKPNDPCRPRAESHLFTIQDAEQETKP